MSDLVALLVLGLVAAFVLANSIKIVDESERLAVFALGRFLAFKGPGLVLIVPYTQRVHRLRVGDTGTLTSSEFARFGEIDIPFENTDSLRQGQAVRIDRFDGVEPRLVPTSTAATAVCPNCGHRF